MKKNKLLLTIITLCFLYLQGTSQVSQYSSVRKYMGKGRTSTLDSSGLRIIYSLNYIPDSLNPKQVMKDQKILLIGSTMNHFHSEYVRQNDLAMTKDFDQGRNSASLKFPADVQGEGYDIYTNYLVVGQLTVRERITNLSTYKYTEPAEIPQWSMSGDTMRVLSYLCYKATCHYRGRDWEAWYAFDIPVNSGPWKLCGLPGLILKAVDSRNHYVFECVGIEQLQNKQPIIIMKSDATECSREEYRKAQKQFYENYVNTLLTMGFNIYVRDQSDKQVEYLPTPNKKFEDQHLSWSFNIDVADRYRKIPYNPIELE
jgi:GLPGLI family protein